jgi:phosphatidylserine/phosphatidylglycerophosphate/cardiolipin synthase-like enzyme
MIQDDSGDGVSAITVSAITVVLDDLSVLFDQNLGGPQQPHADGSFKFNYSADLFAVPGGSPARQLRLQIRIGRHVLKEVQRDDVTGDVLAFGTIKVTSKSLGWLATTKVGSDPAVADTGEPQRLTSGNAIEWLCDNVDAWGRVADLLSDAATSKTSVDLMQLTVDVEPFLDGAPVAEQPPNVVLAFSKPLSDTKQIVDGDQRIERMILAASQAGSIVRIQIPVIAPGPIFFAAAFVIVAGLTALLMLVIGPIALFLGLAGLGALNKFLPFSKDDVDRLTTWFADAGATNVRVRAFHNRVLSWTHGKIIINGTKQAVLLGSPFEQCYFDSQDHFLDNPSRGGSAGKGPIHDMSVAVRGPALAYLREVFDVHWNVADPHDPLDAAPSQPKELTQADLQNTPGQEYLCSVQVVRTINSDTIPSEPPGEQGVLEAYLRAIHFAEHFIYIENQYFTDDAIVDALIDALKARPSLQLILLLNIVPDVPLYPGWQRAALRRIAEVADRSRLGVFSTWSHAAPDATHPKPRLRNNYLHTKSAIIDNRWATVGSANLDGTSLDRFQLEPIVDNRDSETNCVVFAEPSDTETRAAIDALRVQLWREHLGTLPPTATLDATDTPLQLWRDQAEAKRKTLNNNPNAPSDTHILEWRPDFQISEPARIHLGTVGVLVAPFDVVEEAPSYDFLAGGWKK